jgi:3,4-dihydroxy-2-butanone 4-phosphate synthase
MATDKIIINSLIVNLISKLPAELQTSASALAVVYGRLTLEELQASWNLCLAGDTEAPLKLALSTMTPAELDADGTAFTAQVQADADANAESVKTQETALSTIASVLLSILLAAI